jgi:hypothetical protein
VSVGRCVHARAYVLLRCVFDCLSRVGPQDTGLSGFGFLRLGRGARSPVRVSSSPPVTFHSGIHAIAASPSSWSTGLPLISPPRGMENCRVDHAFIRAVATIVEPAPPTPASHIIHIQQPFLSDSVIPGLQMLLRPACYCAHPFPFLNSKMSLRALASSGQALVDHVWHPSRIDPIDMVSVMFMMLSNDIYQFRPVES